MGANFRQILHFIKCNFFCPSRVASLNELVQNGIKILVKLEMHIVRVKVSIIVQTICVANCDENKLVGPNRKDLDSERDNIGHRSELSGTSSQFFCVLTHLPPLEECKRAEILTLQ